MMHRRSFFAVLAGGLEMCMAQPSPDWPPNRPKVPGTLNLRARRREINNRVSEQTLRWDVAQTAIIIIDMWDTHTCHLSAQRVAAMAPRMNQVVDAARSLGVMIIHAPSDTMKFYEGRPERLRMQRTPKAPSPFPVRATEPDADELLKFPLKAACDDPIFQEFKGPAPLTTRGVYPWEREHPAIEIAAYDGISDNGQEIYNYCKQEGITNVALMGVHTNICILNRAFGVREMTRLGFNVVVARDLTDAMYDPRKPPFVSHARGTDLVIEHIEANWCPTILSEDLTRIISGTDGPSRTAH